MKTKFWKTLFLLVILTSVITQFSCIKEDDEEIRFYVTDSTPTDGYYIRELYVVESPAGTQGNWGSNILNDNTNGPNGWQQYSFDPGTYDYKVVYLGKYYSSDVASFLESKSLDHTFANGRGKKFDLDGYSLYITSFSFSQ